MKSVLRLAVALAFCAGATSGETISVGFREDAAPFIFQEGSDPPRFAGFLADLCTSALERAQISFTAVPVDSRTRFEKLAAGEIDLLCDTTSVTMERARDMLFSPMVYVSGVSYLYSANAEKKLIEAYQNQPADQKQPFSGRGPNCDNLPAGVSPVLKVAVLPDTTARLALSREDEERLFRLRRGMDETVCYSEDATSYREGVAALCAGEVAFFLGDRDMLSYYLDAYLKTGECDALLSGRFLSYEPYAFVVRDGRVDLAKMLQEQIFGLFRSGKAEELFRVYFSKTRKSDLLEALFRLNSVGALSPEEE